MKRVTDTKDVVVYNGGGNLKIEVLADANTVWLNRQQLALMFGRDIKTVGKHIANALKEELKGVPTVAKFATTGLSNHEFRIADAEQAIRYVLDTLLPPIKERKPIGFHT